MVNSTIRPKTINPAMLPPSDILSTTFSDYFILYRPLDIVSGDFYWFKQVNNYILIAAADCTGHGVPGAFMSMLGISFLNEIVIGGNERRPDIILNHLRELIKSTLSQTGKEGESRDGMDIALCVIDLETNILEYSGAYNPLYLFRDGVLLETKADKMPVGIFLAEKESFTHNCIKIEKGDRIYIFSDGYVSQFGGLNSKKFKTKRFKEILTEIHFEPMRKQKELLNDMIVDWQGDHVQTDDILILGIKI